MPFGMILSETGETPVAQEDACCKSLNSSPGQHCLPGAAYWQPAIAKSGLQVTAMCPVHCAAAACNDAEHAEAAYHFRPVSCDSCHPCDAAAERCTSAGCRTSNSWASTALGLVLPLCTCNTPCLHRHEAAMSAPYLHCCCAAMRPGSSTTSFLSAWPTLGGQARSKSR